MKSRLLFDVPQYKKLRVIIDTDAACEADDPFAIAQALMSPKLMVKGILAEHFAVEDSVKRSYDEVCTILDAMDMKEVPVFMGETGAKVAGYFENSVSEESVSPAAEFLIKEALREDTALLFVLCQGAITNVAVAIKKCPEILNRMTIVWIGTHGLAEIPWREFNSGERCCCGKLRFGSCKKSLAHSFKCLCNNYRKSCRTPAESFTLRKNWPPSF